MPGCYLGTANLRLGRVRFPLCSNFGNLCQRDSVCLCSMTGRDQRHVCLLRSRTLEKGDVGRI